MNLSKHIEYYLGIALVLALSLGLFLWPSSGGFVQSLSAIPLVGSLVAALFTLVRDYMAHERKLLLQESQNRFLLGASSHMANTAFDKHVQFAEEYANELHRTLATLFQKGPTQDVLKHTGAMYELHQKYAVWLTDNLETELEQFESDLRKIGASAGYINNSTSKSENIQEVMNVMYQKFAEVMGKERMGADEWNGEKISKEKAASMTIHRLRSILGTEELTEMRTSIITKSINKFRKDG